MILFDNFQILFITILAGRLKTNVSNQMWVFPNPDYFTMKKINLKRVVLMEALVICGLALH
jgi:hypothetical protein